ncbi:AAA family ATPase (plasmid) [Latilactobacillus curvatus]|uniref:AAA family ATPase n=1 Tax=Latilactobacillus curvatus TaxID=28038 RepID=A0AAJ5RMK9_LATCU|nr:AAA family ATPase [Latilactobacillus curvatus]WDC92854.1 AAA family ATPase [Latilactobacillus curvatus]
MEVTIAKREKIKIPILVTGASGSGKTVSSLLIAKGIVEKMYPDLPSEDQWLKIAVIDTEHNRAKYYADSEIGGSQVGEFLHADFKPPYNASELSIGISQLKEKGVEVIILDSLTHMWSGDGGIQNQVDNLNKHSSKNSMLAWGKVKPEIEKLFKLITDSSVFMICTARSKAGYDMEKNEAGKVIPVKIGLKPEIRDGWEYEFAINFNINQDHSAEAIKDNTNMFNDFGVINEESGHRIYEWSSQGIDMNKKRNELILRIEELAKTTELRTAKFKGVYGALNKAPLNEWPYSYLVTMVAELEKLPNGEPVQEMVRETEEGNAFAQG